MSNGRVRGRFGFLSNLLHDIIFAVALFLIDLFDYCSVLFGRLIDFNEAQEFFVKIVESKAFVAILVALVIALIIAVALFGYHKLRLVFLDKHLNRLDIFLLNTLVTGLIYLLLLFIAEMIENRCLIKIGEYVMTIIFGFIAIRVVVVGIIDTRNNKKSSQVLSLSELYKGNIRVIPGKVLLEDTESDDDIFDRTITIDKIASIIKGSPAGKSFTISLVGPWGSGKSTILKCVKRKVEEEDREDIIFVDDFQPWIYKDADKMVVEFGYVLLNKIGYKKSFVSSRAIANAFLKITEKADLAGILSQVKLPEIKEDPIEIINNYLLGHNKKLVIVLDNLERCEPEEIIRFLRIIKNHLQFNNSYYIFSYDEEVMNKGLLKSNIYDRLFLDKFSQYMIEIPDIEAVKKEEVIKKCLENYYGEELKDEKEEILKLAVRIVETPRQLVHFINSCYVGEIDYLNPIDLMLLNVLKDRAPNIYSEIKNNKSKFTFDKSVIMVGMSLNDEQSRQSISSYCTEEAQYFRALQENDILKSELMSNYKIIEYLFPSVSLFVNGKDNRQYFNAELLQVQYDKALVERRFCTNEFFPSYFTYFKNEHIETSEVVDKIVNYQKEELLKTIWDMIEQYENTVQRNNLAYIRKRLNKISKDSCDYLAIGLIEKILSSGRYSNVEEKRIQDAVTSFLSDLIFEVSDDAFNTILNTIKDNYRALAIASGLKNYMRDKSAARRSGRFIKINEIYQKMCDMVLNGVVNLYDSDNYQLYNVRYLDKKDNVVQYLINWKESVDTNKKILMIADFVYREGEGDGFIYGIDHYLYKVFNEDEIKAALNDADKGKLKGFLGEVFNGAKDSRVTSVTGDKYYRSKEEFDIFEFCDEYVKQIDEDKSTGHDRAVVEKNDEKIEKGVEEAGEKDA